MENPAQEQHAVLLGTFFTRGSGGAKSEASILLSPANLAGSLLALDVQLAYRTPGPDCLRYLSWKSIVFLL